MTPLHYPSLELCKRLTEIGFTETEHIYIDDTGYDMAIYRMETINKPEGYIFPNSLPFCPNGPFVCPSVMEMLDVIPNELRIYTDESEQETYGKQELIAQSDFFDFPNSLAKTIIWAIEYGHIKFTK